MRDETDGSSNIPPLPDDRAYEPRFPDLASKLILVTGATTGIGAEIARQAARNGATPLLIGRRRAELEEVARAISADTGRAAPVASADIAEDSGADQIVSAALATGSTIDAIVHCAGVFRYEAFEDSTAETLDAMYRTNVRGPFLLTKAALPHLSKHASIVFIGSNVAQIGYPFTAAYTASKGGVEALARCLAVELAPRGFRVNVVSPGLVKTDMTARLREDPELDRAARAAIPAGRLGETREIAVATLYLCSASSGYVVGSTLTIDGGQSVP